MPQTPDDLLDRWNGKLTLSTIDAQFAYRSDLTFGSWETVTGDENILILAPNPADESLHCGGLIARCCRRGRPPFVMVLTDGSAAGPYAGRMSASEIAARHERETREAVRRLGLPPDRLLMAGLYDNTVPDEGAIFDAVVQAVTSVMWARDCNIICAPSIDSVARHHASAARIANEVAARSGVGLFQYGAPEASPLPPSIVWQLDISPELSTKSDAIAAHDAIGSRQGDFRASYEKFVQAARLAP